MPFHPFGMPFCVESFFWSRRQISSRIRLGGDIRTHRGAKRNSCRQMAPICAKVWRADSDAILVRILTAEVFLRTSVLYPWRLGGGWLFFFVFCCTYRFLQRKPSIENSASSYFRFSENSFCRNSTRAGFLRRVVAVVLSVSLLATKTPVFR